MRGLPAEDLGRHRAQLKSLEVDPILPPVVILSVWHEMTLLRIHP